MIKKLAIAAAFVVVVLLVGAAAVALLVDANRFRPTLESQLSTALGRRVTVGRVRLAILRGGVTVDNVAIADDPAFGTKPFVTAKKLDVGVELMPLITSRAIRVTSLRLDRPRVLLLRKPAGTWNFSSLSQSPPPSRGAARTATPRPDVSVSRLTIADGEVVIGFPGEAKKNRTYRNVTLDARDLSFTSSFPFRLSAVTPGDGAFALSGEAGPLGAGAIDEMPVKAKLQLQHFDIATSGLVDPRAGLAGVIEFAGELSSDGHRSTSTGQLRADRIQLVPGATAARVPIQIDYQTDYDLKTEHGTLSRGDVHVGRALARLSGTFSTRGSAPAVKLALAGKAMPAQELEAALPSIGVALPAGASLQGGTVDADLAIDGPIDGLIIAGPIRVADTKLRSFDLGGKLSAIAALAGAARSADTAIQTLAATLRIAPDGIRMNDIQVVVPSIGSLSGKGSIAPSHAMKFIMAAQPRSGSVLGSQSRLASFGQPESAVPFRIEGTTESPVFVPDVAAAAGNAVKSPQAEKAASSLLKKLLHK